ncbi:MAG: hypothetical protein QOI66_688, partial [Myxococcales bacterium]|nr:hypothetical protein [Myxococcales bacterium]
ERAEGLRAARAAALRAAGDAWLAIGERPRARAAYAQAAEMGASDLSFRLLAAADELPPANMPMANLRQAIAALPLRVLRPFGDVYLRLRGDDRPTLQRLLAAARQDSDSTQVERLREALSKASAPETTSPETPQSPIVLVGVPAAADLDRWVLGGPSLSRRLLPLLAASPDLLAPGDRTRHWSALLLAEDPTSPEVAEVTALIDGLGRRFGGVERKLTDMIYYTPDRFDGFLRAAAVWQRVERPREACVQRVRAARWRDDPEDPTWRDAIACTRGDPGAGDWRAIRQYVLDRAPEEKREALAASLDSGDNPSSAPVARPAP